MNIWIPLWVCQPKIDSLHQSAHYCIEQSHEINCVATQTRVAPKFNWFIGESVFTSHEEIEMKNEENDKSTYISTLIYKW